MISRMQLQHSLNSEQECIHSKIRPLCSGTCQSYGAYKALSLKFLALNTLREIRLLHDHQTSLYAEHTRIRRLRTCVGSARAF